MSQKPIYVDVYVESIKSKENPLCPEIIQVLQNVRPDWYAGDNGLSVKAKVFTGGISNLLFGYYLEGKFDKDVVLVRVYGEGTELMIDRETEKKNIQVLNAAGRCPPLYGSFKNGIAYGFVNGKTLDEKTVRDKTIRQLIAKEMIEVHKVKPEYCEVKNMLWEKFYRFLELGPDKFDDPEKQKEYVARIKPKNVLRAELDQLKAHLEKLNSTTVFSHNDLLLKNIIFNEEHGRVYFIDHEYAMYNYEHFDIGNHFCEYAGVDDLDFNRYPDKAYQLVWLRYYLEQKALGEGRNEDSVTDRDVEDCYVKVNKFALAANLFWGLWALVQARHSIIDFGFLEYAEQKINEYFARKEEFFALQLPA